VERCEAPSADDDTLEYLVDTHEQWLECWTTGDVDAAMELLCDAAVTIDGLGDDQIVASELFDQVLDENLAPNTAPRTTVAQSEGPPTELSTSLCNSASQPSECEASVELAVTPLSSNSAATAVASSLRVACASNGAQASTLSLIQKSNILAVAATRTQSTKASDLPTHVVPRSGPIQRSEATQAKQAAQESSRLMVKWHGHSVHLSRYVAEKDGCIHVGALNRKERFFATQRDYFKYVDPSSGKVSSNEKVIVVNEFVVIWQPGSISESGDCIMGTFAIGEVLSIWLKPSSKSAFFGSCDLCVPYRRRISMSFGWLSSGLVTAWVASFHFLRLLTLSEAKANASSRIQNWSTSS
jgi:hypothetical protein